MLSWAQEPYRVWIGVDSSETRAFDVCVKSLLKRTQSKIDIYPLRQEWLRALGLYTRARDPLASTEFSFSRFLVPVLAGYAGPAVFVDSDFVFLADIKELFDLYDPYFAVQCVQHDYQPTNTTKMGGMIQSIYPRKNWTSLMMFSAGHHIVKDHLTPHEVNRRSGKWLHRLEWCSDTFIGSLPLEWNSLDENPVTRPKACHLTNGIRAIHGNNTYYSDLWDAEAAA